MSTISNLIFKGAKHYITSPFGKRAVINTSAGATASFHNGTDYGTDAKKIPQYAIEDGYVFEAAKASDGANYVWVIYPRVKLAMLHYHLDSYKVKAGQNVVKGTLLGYTGMTGKATGIHLHLGIRNCSKLTAAQIKKMTWDNLRKCDYVDPEKVVYSEAKPSNNQTTATKPTETKPVTKPSTPAKKSVDDIAKEVLEGKWGNGDERKKKIESAGYDYAQVQSRVNALMKPSTTTSAKTYKVGDIVNFKGNKHYISSTSIIGYKARAGKAKITSINKGSKHPYHLVKVSGSSSNVSGWVDSGTFN